MTLVGAQRRGPGGPAYFCRFPGPAISPGRNAETEMEEG
jgi:hypothetical protein